MTLDALRREIDRIDETMHDLLMQRTAVVEEIGRVKAAAGGAATGAGFFRPGREAQVLRRLAARHDGRFPLASLVRIWREIMTGQLRVQTELRVAVFAGGVPARCWDMARDHFGAGAAYLPFRRSHQVVAAVHGGSAELGVLPLPGDEDAEPWWPLLADARSGTSIVARLPVLLPGRHWREGALVVANGPAEPSGEDRGYLALVCEGSVSGNALAADLAAAGIAASPAGDGRQDGAHLFETDAILTQDDPRLAELLGRSRQPILQARPLGGYARPLVAENG